MDDLKRQLAPVSESAWTEIEDNAKRTLKVALAARRVVDFEGPLGWQASAISVGRVNELGKLREGVNAALRVTQPLIELTAPFELQRAEVEAIARGASDADLDPMLEAATRIARAEDNLIFNGYAEAGIRGICDTARSPALSLTSDYQQYPGVVSEALSILLKAGVSGPYAIALGPKCFTGLTKTTQGGYPVMQHVTKLLDGPVVWAPEVDGAVVLSLRGGDFSLSVGRDLSIGYQEHTASTVTLYFQETLTFRVLGPEAAVILKYS